MSPLELDFYLDPVCGWAWRTSLWMREVATQRPLTITWKLASLGVINAPADWQPGSTSHQLRGAHLGRTLVMADRVAGNDAFNRLAISFGNAMHGRADDMNDPAVIARCLADAELPEDLYQAAQADQSTETEMIDQTRAVIQRLKLFGVPTIALAGSDLGVFGPVIHPVPTGHEALELWDVVHLSLKNPYLFELKRTRERYDRPQFADARGLAVDPAAAPA